ncbi:MAG: LUD domain-containing protein [Candidatus Helarchaeota archaeon]
MKQLENNGCHVYLALNKEEALKILKSLLEGKIIVKTKTNTGKEINLTQNLENWGYEVVETDLGDRIVQLAKSKSTHPLIPGLHISKNKIIKLFNADKNISTKDLANIAGSQIRKKILDAKVGITGANAITAEEGFICLVENEGNQRLVTSIPKKHIVIAGIDKIVENAEQAIMVAKAAAYFGLGILSGNYVSFIMGPSRTADIAFEIVEGMHGPSEVHVILLDNHRREIANNKEGFHELLFCVNCGGCLNYCPVYKSVGEIFGNAGGGRHLLFNSFTNDITYAFDFGMNFCTMCGSCVIKCPGEINVPDLMLKLRKKAQEKHLAIPKHKEIAKNIKENFNPFIESRPRDHWLKNLKIDIIKDSSTLLYIGCMSSYRTIDQATNAVKILNKLKIKFDYLGENEPCCSGILKRIGLVDEFNEMRTKLQNKLNKYDEIITICPGCYSTFREFYKDFFDKYNIKLKHIVELIDINKLNINKTKIITTYHDPCHLGRRFGIYNPPRNILNKISTYKEMKFSKDFSNCCGAGGGCMSSFPELAENIASSRIEEVMELNCEYIITTCPFCEYNLRKGNKTKIKVESIQKFLDILLN